MYVHASLYMRYMAVCEFWHNSCYTLRPAILQDSCQVNQGMIRAKYDFSAGARYIIHNMLTGNADICREAYTMPILTICIVGMGNVLARNLPRQESCQFNFHAKLLPGMIVATEPRPGSETFDSGRLAFE